ncbi:MAG TPA: alpha/beta fold hydrolase [Frankiaceae bacterium]|nr:alpha/beta fold hydrolase [Frankiaceae bacterium]
MERREITLHGHRVTYTEAGSDGPVVLLLHGIAGCGHAWDAVLPLLSASARVIAPDLLGHGESAKPRGDYSLGAYASGVRDLLAALDVSSATVVGHSLGGGVAMQFAYQFPEMCERLVLVDSGGLGREVTPLLRAVTLPGAEVVLPVIAHRKVLSALRWAGRYTRWVPARPALSEVARGYASLVDTQARAAFVHTARSVMDVGGQRVDASDRLYLATELPTLVVWGGRDSFIPVAHAAHFTSLVPTARLEVFENSGHFPHVDEPVRFARLLADFLETTEPAHIDPASLRDRLLAGA